MLQYFEEECWELRRNTLKKRMKMHLENSLWSVASSCTLKPCWKFILKGDSSTAVVISQWVSVGFLFNRTVRSPPRRGGMNYTCSCTPSLASWVSPLPYLFCHNYITSICLAPTFSFPSLVFWFLGQSFTRVTLTSFEKRVTHFLTKSSYLW